MEGIYERDSNERLRVFTYTRRSMRTRRPPGCILRIASCSVKLSLRIDTSEHDNVLAPEAPLSEICRRFPTIVIAVCVTAVTLLFDMKPPCSASRAYCGTREKGGGDASERSFSRYGTGGLRGLESFAGPSIRPAQPGECGSQHLLRLAAPSKRERVDGSGYLLQS